MRLVTQRHSAEVDADGLVVEGGQRGDCVAACLASIFELPIDVFPPTDDRQWLWRWLAVYYPGVSFVHKQYGRPTEQAPGHTGLHLAGIVSSRFRERCTDCNEEIEESTPFFFRRDECPWCGGSGIRPGHHSVVMKGSHREWDPHPDADWDAPLTYVSETLFIVTDVARLAPRMVPAPYGVLHV